MSASLKFLANSFKNFKSIGAVIPSSRYVANVYLDNIDFSRANSILELGAGTGAITRRLLGKIKKDARVVSIEMNPEFIVELKKLNDPRLDLVQTKAQEYSTKKKFDYIVSTLPFSLMNPADKEVILSNAAKMLSSNGKFIVYEYMPNLKHDLLRHFRSIKTILELRNLPPARIFICSNS